MPKQGAFVFTGFRGMNYSSGVESLGATLNSPDRYNVYILENGRITEDGGIYVRNGIEKVIDLNTSNPVISCKGVETDNFQIMLFKSGTAIYQTSDPDSGVCYDIGVTRTTGEKEFFFAKRKDVFAINKTDNFLQIAVTTIAAINTGASTVTVRTGDVGDLAASGTIYIRGIAVTYSGKSGSDLTGCSGLTAAMAVGDIITQTTAHTSAPKGTCMAELDGSSLVGGVSTDPSALYWSEPSSDTEPELFYVYPTTYVIPMPRDITGLLSGNDATLIGMRKGIKFTNQFEPNTGVPRVFNASSVHSIANAYCMDQMVEDVVVLTQEGRILPAGQTDAGFKIISDPRRPRQDMDFPIKKYIQKNMDKSDGSSNFTHFDPSTSEVSSSIKFNTSINNEIVLQSDTGDWSVDTSKNFACKTVFKGITYGGSDSKGRIYKDNAGRTDDEIPIRFRMLTGLMSIDERRINFDVLGVTVSGLLSATGEFAVRVVVDGVSYSFETSADELIENGDMDTSTGIPIGRGRTGAEEIGSGGDAVEGYRFDFPIELSYECRTVQIEIESLDEGTALEVRELRIDIETEAEQLINTF